MQNRFDAAGREAVQKNLIALNRDIQRWINIFVRRTARKPARARFTNPI